MRTAVALPTHPERVSTKGQTVEKRELEATAARHGWQIVQTFEDAHISARQLADGGVRNGGEGHIYRPGGVKGYVCAGIATEGQPCQ